MCLGPRPPRTLNDLDERFLCVTTHNQRKAVSTRAVKVASRPSVPRHLLQDDPSQLYQYTHTLESGISYYGILTAARTMFFPSPTIKTSSNAPNSMRRTVKSGVVRRCTEYPYTLVRETPRPGHRGTPFTGSEAGVRADPSRVSLTSKVPTDHFASRLTLKSQTLGDVSRLHSGKPPQCTWTLCAYAGWQGPQSSPSIHRSRSERRVSNQVLYGGSSFSPSSCARPRPLPPICLTFTFTPKLTGDVDPRPEHLLDVGHVSSMILMKIE